MRKIVLGLCVFGFFAVIAATPTITGVTAQQRYPWNGKVDISYTVTGDIAAEAKQRAVFTSLKVMAIDKVANTKKHCDATFGRHGTHRWYAQVRVGHERRRAYVQVEQCGVQRFVRDDARDLLRNRPLRRCERHKLSRHVLGVPAQRRIQRGSL